MKPDPRLAFRVVEDFERAIADYCGAPYAVSVDSCTNALYLCLRRHYETEGREALFVPKHTYVGVAQAARNAGHYETFRDILWVGEYEMLPTRVWDSAKWLRAGMYRSGTLTCLSFQAYKQLPIGRGGAILCDDEDDAEWLRRARFDGRDMATSLYEQKRFGFGGHMYLDPPSAARGLWLMQGLKDNAQPIGDWTMYPDLSTKEWT